MTNFGAPGLRDSGTQALRTQRLYITITNTTTKMLNRILITYKAAYSGLPREAWLLAFVVLINRAGSMVLFFMTLYLTSQMEYTVSEAGQMISIYGIGSLFGAYLGGWLSDKIGPQRVQIFSLIASGFVFVILAYMTTSLTIAITLFLLALINEAFRPANATAFSEICPPEMRARGFGLLRLAVNFGVAIGPAIGGFLALVNYKLLFWIDGVTCILAAVILVWLMPKTDKKSSPIVESDDQPVRSPWRDMIFILLLLVMLYMGMAFVQVFSTWPLFLREINLFSEDRIGLLLAFNALVIVLFEMPLIHKIERKNPVRIMALGALFLFIGFSLTPVSSSYLFLLFTVLIWTIGEMLVFPVLAGFIANRASDSNRGQYMGMYTFTFALSFVFGPISGAYIYDNYGPYFLWFGIGIVGLAVLIIFRFINDRMEKIKFQ